MPSLSRRLALKIFGIGAGLCGLQQPAVQALQSTASEKHPWSRTPDRIWLGEQYWANPMEDWRIEDGGAECQTGGGNRNIHLITHQLTDAAESFEMSVGIQNVGPGARDGGAGFRIGIRSDINDHRSNAFTNSGLTAGVVGGKLTLGRQQSKLTGFDSKQTFQLQLEGSPAGEKYKLTLTASRDGEKLASVTAQVAADTVLGNVAVVSNYDPKIRKQQGSRYRFTDWVATGEAFQVSSERKFGPILWSMYTLSDSRSDEGFVLKISALTGPLGSEDDHSVELEVARDGSWVSLGKASLDQDAWTATFRIANWDEKKTIPYRLVYRQKYTDGETGRAEWGGVIRSNPVGRPVRLGGLTCQKDYGFPYAPVAENVVKLDPDLLFFAGDQLYEDHGGFGLIRDPAGPAILNYLRKFYMFGWAFREAMRNCPTVCIPDDHDVFQGNIWGEGGAKMTSGSTSSKGGYREPARMVNVVHTTCAGHHPDYFDSTPCKQNISVYYGDLVYGNVSFAILGDRQWKSGPERVETGSGRADHVLDPNFDTSVLDKPGLELLGERQEKFLEHWVKEWRGHSMKVLLSQTVFAGVATHHGRKDAFLTADLDSGGWPQTARQRTVRILREGMPLHVNGDQHLTTLSQYGADRQRDSCWSFCVPAIAAGYPRWWRPDEVGYEHQNRPRHGREHTGEYKDGFGNKIYVYAVGNPEVGRKKNRYELAHQKGSGFGLILIDTEARTYELHSYRFLIDAMDGKESNEFPGWPVTIHQAENQGENRLG